MLSFVDYRIGLPCYLFACIKRSSLLGSHVSFGILVSLHFKGPRAFCHECLNKRPVLSPQIYANLICLTAAALLFFHFRFLPSVFVYNRRKTNPLPILWLCYLISLKSCICRSVSYNKDAFGDFVCVAFLWYATVSNTLLNHLFSLWFFCVGSFDSCVVAPSRGPYHLSTPFLSHPCTNYVFHEEILGHFLGKPLNTPQNWTYSCPLPPPMLVLCC